MLNKLDNLISLCKRRGFIFQSSEIYGGQAASYDFGHLGVLLKNNIKKAWWDACVKERDDMVGLDGAILMHPKIWQASGHLQGFFDMLIECKSCHTRFRQDEISNSKLSRKAGSRPAGKTQNSKLRCPSCGKKDFTKPRKFELMFKAGETYLRPETAQGIFVNFKNILKAQRAKLPFGVAQIGKAFRNEITPKNFIFKTREFEQMEIEYFVRPKEAEKWYKYWVAERFNWYIKYGIKKENLRLREHKKEELAHYAVKCHDIEYKFPFGFSELEGIANRCDYDLKQHQKYSGCDLTYFDEVTKEKYLPYIIEPSGGIDRALLAFLVDAYEEVGEGRSKKLEARSEIILHLHPVLAPIKAAVFPLVNKERLPKIAKEIYQDLKKDWFVEYDETGSIGRRYRRQDEIATPFCLTVDFQTQKDKTITIRDRDSMQQKRIKIKNIKDYLKSKIRS